MEPNHWLSMTTLSCYLKCGIQASKRQSDCEEMQRSPMRFVWTAMMTLQVLPSGDVSIVHLWFARSQKKTFYAVIKFFRQHCMCIGPACAPNILTNTPTSASQMFAMTVSPSLCGGCFIMSFESHHIVAFWWCDDRAWEVVASYARVDRGCGAKTLHSDSTSG